MDKIMKIINITGFIAMLIAFGGFIAGAYEPSKFLIGLLFANVILNFLPDLFE